MSCFSDCFQLKHSYDYDFEDETIQWSKTFMLYKQTKSHIYESQFSSQQPNTLHHWGAQYSTKKNTNTSTPVFTVFDLDDTLFVTSFIIEHLKTKPWESVINEFAEDIANLDMVVCEILSVAASRGKVCIISAATNSHIERIINCLPKSKSVIEQHSIATKSSFDNSKGHGSFKTNVFREFLIYCQSTLPKITTKPHFISIGDGLPESLAMDQLYIESFKPENNQHWIFVKERLAQGPNFWMLINQLKHLKELHF